MTRQSGAWKILFLSILELIQFYCSLLGWNVIRVAQVLHTSEKYKKDGEFFFLLEDH